MRTTVPVLKAYKVALDAHEALVGALLPSSRPVRDLADGYKRVVVLGLVADCPLSSWDHSAENPSKQRRTGRETGSNDG